MNRRQFLQVSAGAPFVLPAMAQNSFDGSSRLKIDAYSRHLQWLRTADEVAEAAAEMGFDGLDITVRPYPGHIDPTRVTQDLPPFVKAVRKHGLQVSTITCPITDAESLHAEEILKAASDLDIRHYWWGTFRYEKDKPIMQQLDGLKPRVAKLAALNAKYGMTAMYHTYAGNSMVGAALWDFLYVLKDFDPAFVGLHYDIGHMTNAGGLGTWETSLRAAGPYVRGVSVKDSLIEKIADGNNGANPGGLGRGGQTGFPEARPGERWHPHYMPLGQGDVQLQQFASLLKEIKFSGPIEIQAEYENGGAQDGLDKITIPREKVLGAMKQDLDVLRRALHEASLV